MLSAGNVERMAQSRRASHPREIGARIRERREELGFKQEQLAALVGITQGTLSAIERGRTKQPEAETILGIASALRTSPYLLVYDYRQPEAMEHPVAAIVHIWDKLTEKQRLQVVAYAQGLADAGGNGKSNQSPKPPPPKRPPPSGGSH